MIIGYCHGSLVMSPFFTSPNHDRYMVFFMATILGDVQYSQVMGHLPTPVVLPGSLVYNEL